MLRSAHCRSLALLQTAAQSHITVLLHTAARNVHTAPRTACHTLPQCCSLPHCRTSSHGLSRALSTLPHYRTLLHLLHCHPGHRRPSKLLLHTAVDCHTATHYRTLPHCHKLPHCQSKFDLAEWLFRTLLSRGTRIQISSWSLRLRFNLSFRTHRGNYHGYSCGGTSSLGSSAWRLSP